MRMGVAAPGRRRRRPAARRRGPVVEGANRRGARLGGAGCRQAGLSASTMARAASLSVNQTALIFVYSAHSAGSDSSG